MGDDFQPGITDSAGTPWAGRRFDENRHADDDGSAPPALVAAVVAFRAGECGQPAVIDALREARLLIPLLAELGEAGVNDAGVTIDKSQELSIVTVQGPDGRSVLPVFSSVAAMATWNPQARPVPATGVRVALAAASENTDLVVLDAMSETEFVVRRPALWAMAKENEWMPAFEDPDVAKEFRSLAADEPAVTAVAISAGDAGARLAGPEVVVRLSLVAGLDESQLQSLLSRQAERWAASELIAARVDSLAVQVVGTLET